MRKNPLALTATVALPEPDAYKDIDKFIERLLAKMEGKLHAKEDTFTLAYYIIRTHRTLYKWGMWNWEHEESNEYEHVITYEGAAALAYELKTYPARPREGILVQLLSELDRGLRERKQDERERKRIVKRRNRPTVREDRQVPVEGTGGS